MNESPITDTHRSHIHTLTIRAGAAALKFAVFEHHARVEQRRVQAAARRAGHAVPEGAVREVQLVILANQTDAPPAQDTATD